MNALDTASAERLAKICGLFGSDHDGERATAARMADKFLRGIGLRWSDIIVANPPASAERDWRQMVKCCNRYRYRLTDRERAFIGALQQWRGKPTDRQEQWLADIYSRLQGGER